RTLQRRATTALRLERRSVGSGALDVEQDIILADAGAGTPLDAVPNLGANVLERLGLALRARQTHRRATRSQPVAFGLAHEAHLEGALFRPRLHELPREPRSSAAPAGRHPAGRTGARERSGRARRPCP